VSVTAGAWPEPVNAIVCGLPPASSVTETAALRLPEALGVKVTEIEQVAPAARVAGEVGHVLVWAKSPAFAPVTAMPEMVSGALPVFVRVELWDALVVPTARDPKSRLVGLRPTLGAAAAPVPVSGRLCGLPEASSVIDTDAEREPAAPGVNVTEIVQVALTASVAGLSGHVFSWAKSAAFVPVMTTLLIVIGAVPELRSVAL
jgi:hypothetical protein